MSSKKNKTAKKAKKNRWKKNTPDNNEPTTDTKGRRSASPDGQPAFSPAIPTENDDKDESTQGVLALPLQTDQLPTNDQQSATITDSSQKGGGIYPRIPPPLSRTSSGCRQK